MYAYWYKMDTNGYILIQMDTYGYIMDTNGYILLQNGYINVSILKYKLGWNSPPSTTNVL